MELFRSPWEDAGKRTRVNASKPEKRTLSERRTFLLRRRSDVPGTRTNHLICLILLNAMADPADGSSQRKESDCTSRRQIQRTSERNKAEKDRWAFAEQVVCFLSDTLREKHGGGVRVDLSGQLKQEFSPWVAHGVENSAKSGNHFSKSGNGFASFE